MPTRTGWGVLAITLVAAAAGIALDWVELVVIAAVGAVALVIGFAWVQRHPRLAVALTLAPSRVTAGDPSRAVATVTNRGRLPLIPIPAEVPFGNALAEIRIPRLRAGDDALVDIDLPTRRRGVVDVGPLTLVRRDLFGLFRSASPLGGSERLWVHPRRHALAVRSSGRTHDLDAPTSDRSPAGTITFHAIREYVEGDDLRFVHWRSTARTGTLMVRQNVDTSRPSTTILLDTRAEAHTPASFEVAAEVAASIAAACDPSGFPVRILTSGASVSGTDRQVTALNDHLDFLAGLEPGGQVDPAVMQAARPSVSGAALVVVAGTLGTGDRSALAQVALGYDRVTVVDVRPDADSGERAFLPDAAYIAAATGPDFAAGWNEASR